MKKLVAAYLVAFGCWFVMFSPWTAPHVNFWYAMACAGILLILLACLWGREWMGDIHISLGNIVLGVAIAAVLWGVFWVGDKLSQLLFAFARPQVDLIYGLKGGTPPLVIAALLFFIIGPAEEIFWRGFLQKQLMKRYGQNMGYVWATLAYTLIHIWSFNFMLIMAALVIGALWGLLYRLSPRWLFPLIVSHALWDCAAFVFFPF